MKQRQRGFTLIELIIVIAIMGIMAGVALPSFQEFLIKREIGNAKSQITQTLELARQIARSENTLVDVTFNNRQMIVMPKNQTTAHSIVKFSPRIDILNSEDKDLFAMIFRPVGSLAIIQDGNVIDAPGDFALSIAPSNATNDDLKESIKVGIYGSVASNF